MIFSFRAPLWPQKNKALEMKSSIENENFNPENENFMREWFFRARGNGFFHAFERELIFSISGPSGKMK